MAPSTLDRKDGMWLEGHAHEWVAAGLISPDQAQSIKRFEHLDEPVPPQRLTIVTEVATYLGSVIAFAGGAAIVGRNWEKLGLVGQGAVALAIAVVGFTVGAWLVRLGEDGATRLGTFLWVVGTGGVALAVAGVVNEIDPRQGAWFAVAIGVSVLAIGVALWRNLDRPLQLLTSVAGLGIGSVGVGLLSDLPAWVGGILVWATAAGFGMFAAFDHVRPRLVALAVAAVGAMVGAVMLSDLSENLGAVAGVVTAALVVSYALYDRSVVLLAIAMAEFFVGTMAMMSTVLTGTLPRLGAVLVGLAVVAYVAVRSQRMGPAGPGAAAS